MTEIVKGDGSRELFNIHKLADSLARSGANKDLAIRVSEQIASSIQDGMSTTEIYRNAYKILHKEERIAAARYSMRRAILELGPTGYPFEDYVSELMRAKGYEVRTRVMVPGRCIEHEVDVVMTKDGKTIGAELKFHNQPGFKTDVKIALYVKARFDDIDQAVRETHKEREIHEGWLITNTKFTDHAIRYASCGGINLLGWDYPNKGNLDDLIRETGVYPITVLTSLTGAEKNRLLASQVPLCSMVAENPALLRNAGVPDKKVAGVIAESTALCKV
ncbi:MAG: ATP cone domain-containing protein [Patescibacteria group bacterium]